MLEPTSPCWEPDGLLDGYEQTAVGPATLVRTARPTRTASERAGASAVVLHVHGYNDYFFQTHLADAVRDAGHDFYAVDLRRAGRSLARADDGLPPHFAASLREPGADVDAAARLVRASAPGVPLVVHAHSTGGLTAALWAHAVRDDPVAPDLLVLDSPFLDLTGSWLARSTTTPVLEVLGRRRPLAVLSTAPSMYATYQHVSGGGRWNFDRSLKKPGGQPVRAGWLRTVRHAQLRLARGLQVGCPVLVARSDASGPDSPANPHLDAQDTVLDVARIAAVAPRIGPDVTELVVPGGVHDLTLSADDARAAYLGEMLAWVAAQVPGAGRRGHETGAA